MPTAGQQEALRAPAAADAEALVLLEQQIRRLNDHYCGCLDDRDFDRWPDFFVDDCLYLVQSHENHTRGLPHADIYCAGKGMLRDRVSATGVMVYEARQQRRFTSALRVLDTGPNPRAVTNFMLTEAMIDRDPVLALTGRFDDEFAWVDGRLLLRRRICVYDNYRIVQNLIFPV